MAARGAVSKEVIIAKLLEVFPGSFKYDKEIRIPMEENGETVQIKVTLTAAKTNVECGNDTILPGVSTTNKEKTAAVVNKIVDKPVNQTEPTPEEKANLQKLMATLF